MSWQGFLELTNVPNQVHKVVSVSTVESKLGDEAALSKAKQKHKAKVSAQSSQIRDLHSKLDAAIAENSQIREFFKPETLCKL